MFSATSRKSLVALGTIIPLFCGGGEGRKKEERGRGRSEEVEEVEDGRKRKKE